MRSNLLARFLDGDLPDPTFRLKNFVCGSARFAPLLLYDPRLFDQHARDTDEKLRRLKEQQLHAKIEGEADSEPPNMPDPSDPRFISGIYNYCDRWCERCAFSHRCLNFAMEQQREPPVERDSNNQAFWDQLSANFARTGEMIRQMAEEMGADLSPEALAEVSREEQAREQRAAEAGSDIDELATDYLEKSAAFFDAHEDFVTQRAEELASQVQLGIAKPADAKGAIVNLADAVEVIRWYESFIVVKLKRAFYSREDERIEPEPDFPSDADGSAKVALIAIDRSLAAWTALREFCVESEHQDEALDAMVMLDRLRTQVEAEFPQARAFHRPGFDDAGEQAA